MHFYGCSQGGKSHERELNAVSQEKDQDKRTR